MDLDRMIVSAELDDAFVGTFDQAETCLLYTSDAADDMQCVDLGGRRIIKKIFFFKQKTAYEM